MARDERVFQKAFDEVKWYTNFHKKPVWLVPLKDGYAKSVFKPSPESLPAGTSAVLFDIDLKEIDRVASSLS